MKYKLKFMRGKHESKRKLREVDGYEKFQAKNTSVFMWNEEK